MNVLVDTSVWIDYFRDSNASRNLDLLIDENIIINEIILAELIPYLKIKKQKKVIDLLNEINKIPLNIN